MTAARRGRGLAAAGILALLAIAALALLAPRSKPRPEPPAAPTAPGPVSRPAPRVVEPPPSIVFHDRAKEAGLTVSHFDAADGRFRLVEAMGGGVALWDFDGDGWLDVFLAQGAAIPDDPADDRHACQLYRNNRDGTFTDVARSSGLSFKGFAQGVAVGDYDGDGHDDLYVAGFNHAALYRNHGNRTFTDVTREAGLTGFGWATSCAFADLDADGDLDLYVVRYLADTVDAAGRPTVSCNALPGRVGYCPPLAFSPERDSLYRNNGDSTFTDVRTGTADGNGLGLAVADFDDDGRLDVFVANDKTPNLLFHNLGGLTFQEVGLPWGVAYNETGEAMAGMGVAAGDHDGDGRTDLLVTNFYEEGATLYRNAAPGRFEVVTARARLKIPTRGTLGFGAGFFDADNDGWLDLFVANGHVNDVSPLRMPYRMTPQFFRNAGQGRFDDLSPAAGAFFQVPRLGRGAAIGDLDNDGKTDVVVTHNDEPPALLINQTVGENHALRLSLTALTPTGKRDRNPVGARVTVGATRPVYREVTAGTSYLSRNDPRLLIGIGASSKASRVVVKWPSGKTETWTDVPADTPFELWEGESPRRREVRPAGH